MDNTRATTPRFDLPRLCLWIALVLALVGTVGNTAWAFASVDSGAQFMSYVKAIALDVGMVAVAATLAQRKRANAPTLWLWVAVACFVGGSMYANYLHGQTHLVTLTANLADWRPVILSALLPLMLFALVEIVAHAPAVRPEPPLPSAPSDAATAPPAHSEPQSEPPAPLPALAIAPVRLTCKHCERPFDTLNALNAHEYRCKAKQAPQPPPISANGNGHHA